MSFLIKSLSQNKIQEELSNIGFDKNYLDIAKNKYKGQLYKIFDLTPVQATILKQTALSCGTDFAVSHGVLTHEVDLTDGILFATNEQLKLIINKLSMQQFKLNILGQNLENAMNKRLQPIQINKFQFNWKKTYIMGILNYTDNSFSDGGEFNSKDRALEHFKGMINHGADIIDIGAESTAPMNNPISPEEEIQRLFGILADCRKIALDIPISIDTRNSKTAAYALEIADIINDVSGLTHDENMAEIIAKSDAYCILTFSDEIRENVLDETIKGLMKKVEFAVNKGINKEKIILDAGLGFNKTYEQNFELIKYANEICSLGFPVLYGLSRKSFVQNITGLKPKETTCANISLASYLASKGVNIFRVHDVLEHKIAFQGLDKVLYD